MSRKRPFDAPSRPFLKPAAKPSKSYEQEEQDACSLNRAWLHYNEPMGPSYHRVDVAPIFLNLDQRRKFAPDDPTRFKCGCGCGKFCYEWDVMKAYLRPIKFYKQRITVTVGLKSVCEAVPRSRIWEESGEPDNEFDMALWDGNCIVSHGSTLSLCGRLHITDYCKSDPTFYHDFVLSDDSGNSVLLHINAYWIKGDSSFVEGVEDGFEKKRVVHTNLNYMIQYAKSICDDSKSGVHVVGFPHFYVHNNIKCWRVTVTQLRRLQGEEMLSFVTMHRIMAAQNKLEWVKNKDKLL